MKLGKTILTGIPVLVLVGVIYWFGNTLKEVWQPVIRLLPKMEGWHQWFLSFVLSIVLLTITGYGMKLLHPIKLIARRTTFYKKFILNGSYKVVRINTYKKTQALGVLEEVIEGIGDNPTLYKVIVPNPPIPVSGLLYFVERENLHYTDLTPIDLFNQLTAFGLKKIGIEIFESK